MYHVTFQALNVSYYVPGTEYVVQRHSQSLQQFHWCSTLPLNNAVARIPGYRSRDRRTSQDREKSGEFIFVVFFVLIYMCKKINQYIGR